VSRTFKLTVPEWVLLGGVTLILATLCMAGLMALRLKHSYQAVQNDLVAVSRACQLFFDEYGYWPTDRESDYGDARYGREHANSLVMNALRAISGPGNYNHTRNPGKIIFLEAGTWQRGRSGLDREGRFLDAWGTPYQMVLDADLNNRCEFEHSIYRPLKNAGVALWSCGPDRISDTSDDLLSWKQE